MGWSIAEIFGQKKCSMLFFTLTIMPVVPVILTRNVRYCSQFPNNVFAL